MRDILCTETLENVTLIWKGLYINTQRCELRMKDVYAINNSALKFKMFLNVSD